MHHKPDDSNQINHKTSPYDISFTPPAPASATGKAYGQALSSYASQHTGKPTNRTRQRPPDQLPAATLYVNLNNRPGEFKLVVREPKALAKVLEAIASQQLPAPVEQQIFVVQNSVNSGLVAWFDKGEGDAALLQIQVWLVTTGVKTYFCYDPVAA
jgi:hypothetical protein